jgi:hypothetical protein
VANISRDSVMFGAVGKGTPLPRRPTLFTDMTIRRQHFGSGLTDVASIDEADRSGILALIDSEIDAFNNLIAAQCGG